MHAPTLDKEHVDRALIETGKPLTPLVAHSRNAHEPRHFAACALLVKEPMAIA